MLTHLTAVSAVIEAIDEEAGGSPTPVEYFPVSATSGEGVAALVEAVVARMPEGPRYYPEGMVTDVAEAFWVADLVREELLHRVQDELPHSIACRVTEWEWPRVRCEILVERDSQKGIVIGKGGATLKEVGTAVRGPDAARAPTSSCSCGWRSGGSSARTPSTGSASDRTAAGPAGPSEPVARCRGQSSAVIRRRKATTSARSTVRFMGGTRASSAPR